MCELYDVTLLVIVSFKFYVMNFVDFVFNCYTYITSHVSQAFANCTHYTSYYLLNIVHVIVSLVWPTKFANTLSFYAKQIWCLRIYGKCLMILILGKLGLKLLFLKNISSHTHAFCSSISMFWGVPKMCFVFFQNCVFLSKFKWVSVVSIDRVCFSIN